MLESVDPSLNAQFKKYDTPKSQPMKEDYTDISPKMPREAVDPITDRIQDGKIIVKVIGLGGAGNNTVDRLKLENLDNICLAVVNTDSQVLAASPIHEKVMVGRTLTRGLGAGGEIEVGRQAAEEDRHQLERMVQGVDLIFLMVGLGGGTGSGCAPILAEVAADAGALIIAFVTMPFTLEGARRHRQAEDSLAALRKGCHAVVTLPNDILLQQVEESATVLEAFALADEWVTKGVRSICSMLQQTGLINVDFSTLRQAFQASGGKTLFGLGSGKGENYVTKAIESLMLCPLLHTPDYSRWADNLIVNIAGGPDLTMAKVNEIVSVVAEKFGSKENTLIGATIDGSMAESVSICVVGTTDVNDGIPHYAKTEAAHSGLMTAPSTRSASNETRKRFPSVHRSKLSNGKKGQDQKEFDFISREEQRGYFDETERNLFEGEDLDVPTYLRRGIKIRL